MTTVTGLKYKSILEDCDVGNIILSEGGRAK
jgi:hypothetical protein